jgi:hypothetical protein
MATVWEKEGLGMHSGSSLYILSHLENLLDEFINAYLKINVINEKKAKIN